MKRTPYGYDVCTTTDVIIPSWFWPSNWARMSNVLPSWYQIFLKTF